jgi:hypothetical protein
MDAKKRRKAKGSGSRFISSSQRDAEKKAEDAKKSAAERKLQQIKKAEEH